MIKVTIEETKHQCEKPFPKLMKSNCGSIVLFKEDRTGVLIAAPEYQNIKQWQYSSQWNMEIFTDYNEPITIQND